ncbi:MAG: CesT family type III secretion system chaperone [Gammaproteobacteria bacterium]|nr:CesT family type III secretion system chaperone [Gammaproteobacteria bacterium]
MANLALLLDELARRNAMEAPRPDADGRFHVVADDDVHVACFERFGQLCLVSPLGRIPDDQTAAAWLRRLLNAALKRMKGSRCTPAVDADGGAVVFARCALADLSVRELETLIEEHVNAHEGYQRAVAQARAPEADLAERFARQALRP